MKKKWLQDWENNEPGLYESKINQELVEVVNLIKFDKERRVLVPLCGKSADLFWLGQQGFSVTGIELSQKACEEFFTQNHMSYQKNQNGKFIHYQQSNIDLFCGDFFEMEEKQFPSFQFIYDCAALIALPAHLRKEYVFRLASWSHAGTVLLLIVIEYNKKLLYPPYSISTEEVHALFGKHFQIMHLRRERAAVIPAHLVARGLGEIEINTYFMTSLYC